MTPLRPAPRFVPKPWGGRFLQEYYDVPEGLGEAWVASPLPGEAGTLVKGIPLRQLVPGPLPLVKILDSTRALSVQLHPDDACAQEIHGPGHRGKAEAWYFLRAPAEGFVYLGLDDGVEATELFETIRARRNPEHLLKKVAVEAGDAVSIPAGTIHCLTQGAVVAEVQTPGDLTYRLHDWGNLGLDGKPRALHLEWAELVMSRIWDPPTTLPPRRLEDTPGRYRLPCPPRIGFELIRAAEGPVSVGEATTRFALVLLAVKAGVELRSRRGAWAPERLAPGDCVVLPPGSGDLLLAGQGEVVLGYLRDDPAAPAAPSAPR